MKNTTTILSLFLFISIGQSSMAVSNSSYLDNSYKRETDREKTRRLYNYMSIIEESIRFFDKGKYNIYMERLKVDTGFHFTFRSHYEAYNVLNRCMNEGEHNLDITDDEYDQLDSIANSPLTNASAWAAAYLLGINKNDENTSINAVVSNQLRIELYPNPANTVLTIESKELFDGNTARVYNTLGQVVLTANVNQNSIDINNLPVGSYLLKIEKNDNMYVQKFMVEK
jgi:hypothetical protein